jgi:hypothetical protein
VVISSEFGGGDVLAEHSVIFEGMQCCSLFVCGLAPSCVFQNGNDMGIMRTASVV